MRADNIFSFRCTPVLLLALLLPACGFVDSGGSQAPPPASAGPNRTVQEAARVVLDASALIDVGDIDAFQWEQTSGLPRVVLANAASPTASFVAPAIARRTILEFTLTTVNEFGTTNSASVEITINDKPTANAGANRTITRGTEAVLRGGASADTDGRIARFLWRQTAGTQVTLTGANTNPRFTVPLTAQPGEVLTFRLTVTDNDGARATDTVSITVNFPPVANAGQNQVVTEGQRVTLNGTASADPEGNPLRFRWIQTDMDASVRLDGATTATPSFTAPPVALVPRVLTFQLTVTDSAGAMDTDTVTITVRRANLPPVAVNDGPFTVAEGDRLNIPLPGVLANDTDADSVLLAAVLVTDASNGDLTLGPGGAVAYLHNDSNTTSDSFTYRARDDSGNLSNIATVSITITPVNDPPVAVNDVRSISAGGTLNVPPPGVLDNDTDADGDALTATLVSGPSNAALGSFVLGPGGAFNYTHDGSATTSDSFTYTASDGTANSNVATVTINITAATGMSSSCWTSPSAQTLIAHLGSGQPRVAQPVRYALVTNGKKGTATLVDGAAGTFAYTPSSVSARGTDSFKYKTQGTDGKTRTGEVTVIIDPRIMPLGGSITAGVTNGPAQLPVPEARVGYRKPLQQKLTAAGYRMDFVGSQSLGAGVTGFDYQSEAHLLRSVRELATGSRAKDLEYPNTGVYAWLEQNPADFVLLHMGSENLRTASVDDVETVLNEIDRWERDHNAQARVLLARVIDRHPREPRITAFNNQVQAMAKDRIANPANPAYPDHVRVVNQQAALRYPADLSDRVHPNANGYAKMADAWAKAIRAECRPPPGTAVK